MMDPLLAFIIFPYDLDQVVNNDILYFTDKQLQPFHRTPCQMSRWTHLHLFCSSHHCCPGFQAARAG